MDRPSILSILVGEVLYNLRAALDYLVFELARLDSGQIQDQAQFLIENTAKGFGRNKARWLKDINASHIARIEQLQPYNGCQWTKTLRDISNPDKHRTLVILYGSAHQKIILRLGDSQASPGRRTDPSIPEEMDVHNPTINVQFSDGTLVADALHEIKTGVTQTLTDFKPDFQ